MSAGESARETASYWLYRSMAWIAGRLPTGIGRRAFESIGSAAYALLPGVRATVAANQARVLGREPDDPLVSASTKEAFRRYARYWFDTFDAIGWTDARVNEAFRWTNFEVFEDALAAGTGAVAALPHFGNWDVAGRALAARGVRVLSVAERLRPERLYELFLDHRRALRMDIVALDDPSVGRVLGAALASNRIVALVCDRDLTGRGLAVEMFGGTRRLPIGPAALALSSGAPLVAAAVHTTPEGWTCTLTPVDAPRTGERRADAAALTRAVAAEFERIISTEPADWHLFQPGWEPPS